MKPWFFAVALALIAAGTALAQESPPGGGMGGGGMGGGGMGGGHRRGNKSDNGDVSPKPPVPASAPVVLDHAGYEAAWTQCHLNVDLMGRLACYEKLHDTQEAALKAQGGPPPR